MDSSHWHIYIDETGEFEKSGKKKGIFALLVRDDAKHELGWTYESLAQKYMNSKQIHLMEHLNNPQINSLQNELISKTLHYGTKGQVILGFMGYDDPMYAGIQGTGSEMFAANRYLYMLQHLLEHILFLYPGFWGQDLQFSLHPCNRVFPTDSKKVDEYQRLGFRSFTPDNSRESIVYVWDTTALRVFIHRLALDYSAGLKKTGAREWAQFELPVAGRSKYPLIHMVDNLAGIILWSKKGFSKTLQERLNLDLSYGSEETLYRNVARNYLFDDTNRVIMDAPQTERVLDQKYYQNNFSLVLEKSLQEVQSLSLEALEALERYVNQSLRDARGNWSLLSSINNRLLESVADSGEEEKQDSRSLLLEHKLLGHALSIHNHRGEIPGALSAWKALLEKTPKALSFDHWRELASLTVRAAVSKANGFAFAQSTAMLIPLQTALETCIKAAGDFSECSIHDSLIGKITGTVAQNTAFEAPRKPELFPRAETEFLRARDQFSRKVDIKRQNNYLMHLYLDWERIDPSITPKIKAVWSAILSDPQTRDFLRAPSADNAAYMQFDLALALKYMLSRNEHGSFVQTFTLDRLEKWFGQATGEHPFEFILAYLGRMAMRQGEAGLAEPLFTNALDIPRGTDPLRQPTLQTIRAQILAWWAAEFHSQGDSGKALDKLTQAWEIMQTIGHEPGLETILSLNRDLAVDSWFAPAWDGLHKAVTSKTFSAKACDNFLECFTFNYR